MSPYIIKKSRGKDLYWVVTEETGKKHSKQPITLDKAKAQLRILDSTYHEGSDSDSEEEISGGGYYTRQLNDRLRNISPEIKDPIIQRTKQLLQQVGKSYHSIFFLKNRGRMQQKENIVKRAVLQARLEHDLRNFPEFIVDPIIRDTLPRLFAERNGEVFTEAGDQRYNDIGREAARSANDRIMQRWPYREVPPDSTTAIMFDNVLDGQEMVDYADRLYRLGHYLPIEVFNDWNQRRAARGEFPTNPLESSGVRIKPRNLERYIVRIPKIKFAKVVQEGVASPFYKQIDEEGKKFIGPSFWTTEEIDAYAKETRVKAEILPLTIQADQRGKRKNPPKQNSDLPIAYPLEEEGKEETPATPSLQSQLNALAGIGPSTRHPDSPVILPTPTSADSPAGVGLVPSPAGVGPFRQAMPPQLARVGPPLPLLPQTFILNENPLLRQPPRTRLEQSIIQAQNDRLAREARQRDLIVSGRAAESSDAVNDYLNTPRPPQNNTNGGRRKFNKALTRALDLQKRNKIKKQT